jgi:hypothetical protein
MATLLFLLNLPMALPDVFLPIDLVEMPSFMLLFTVFLPPREAAVVFDILENTRLSSFEIYLVDPAFSYS